MVLFLLTLAFGESIVYGTLSAMFGAFALVITLVLNQIAGV